MTPLIELKKAIMKMKTHPLRNSMNGLASGALPSLIAFSVLLGGVATLSLLFAEPTNSSAEADLRATMAERHTASLETRKKSPL